MINGGTVKKVLMVTMSLNVGGAETHITELSKALQSKGVEVIAVSSGGACAERLTAMGIRHYTLPLNSKHPLNLFHSYRELKQIIKKHDIPLIHAHARIPAMLCGILSRRMGIRFVTTAHGVFKTGFPYGFLTDWGQATLAISGDIRDYLKENYGLDDRHIFDTINGVDSERFRKDADGASILREFSIEPGVIKIVNVTRVDNPQHRIPLGLVTAAPILKEAFGDNFRVIIVGGGDRYEEVSAAAQAMNKRLGQQLVITTGNRADVERFLNREAADVFVGISRAALEAMSAERPVVLAGFEGYMGLLTPENLDEAIATNLTCRGGYPEATPERMAQGIIEAIALPDAERARLGAFGRETVRERYSVDKMAADALELYARTRKPAKGYDAVLSGYYGSDNSGDDEILAAIIEALREAVPGVRLAVLSRKPREAARAHGVKAVYTFNYPAIHFLLKRSRLLISGGGTLVQDITSTKSLLYYLSVMNMAIRRGCKLMIYASGIGPLNHPKNQKRAAKTLKKAALITLRDEMSMETLKTLDVTKVKTLVTADAVFGSRPGENHVRQELLDNIGIGGKPYFCVAIREWARLPQGFEESLAGLVRHMSEKHGLTALFIPMQPKTDEDISKRVAESTGCGSVALPGGCGGADIQGVIAGGALTLSMRLHAIIYAAKAGVPVMALSYDPKVEGMMEVFGREYCVPLEEVTLEGLVSRADSIMANRNAIVERLDAVIGELREKALSTSKIAGELIRGEEA